MSCPVSTCVALGGLRDVFVEEPLECVVPGGVVGEAVLPAAPDLSLIHIYLFIAQVEKDQALENYVQALRGYWDAFYRLRRLTLYDFVRNAPIR